MKCLKVPLSEAEKIKSIIIKKGVIDFSYKPIKEQSFLYFPIKEEIKIRGTEIKSRKFEKKEGTKKANLPSSFDILGEIAIIEIKEGQKEKEIAKELLAQHKSIKTVLKKSGIHEGEFRTQKLKYLAGKRTKEAIYKENGISLKLDVEKVYFSPRLSTERKRIYQLVKPNESVLVMFSGCGPYVFVISKNTQAKKIIGIEKNPIAHKYAIENIKLNKARNVELINADVKEHLPKLKETYDRIIMPLPKDAELFLEDAFKVARKGTITHLYGFEHENEFDKAEEKLKTEAKKAGINYRLLNFVKCGNYSPGKYRICLDFEIL